MDWKSLLFLLGAGLLGWFAWRMIKRSPQAFSKENLSKSFHTVGLLTLMIIAIIVVAVLILRN